MAKERVIIKQLHMNDAQIKRDCKNCAIKYYAPSGTVALKVDTQHCVCII